MSTEPKGGALGLADTLVQLAADAVPTPDGLIEQHMNLLLGTLRGRPREPRRLGRYLVHDVLGRGGMGVVFEGHDDRLDRKVALKQLDARLSERHAGRLVREAKALAKLSHPNVVQVYEVEEDRGCWFIAMELVEGETLRAWQERRPSWRECVRVYMQAGAGLAAAHAAGLTHRDFKPDNCIIDAGRRVRVLDFGLVLGDEPSTLDEPPSASMVSLLQASDVRGEMTKTGTLLGTPGYMPLEQLEGRTADARSDQFSFCVSLYEAVYGERPFDEGSLGKRMVAVVADRVRPAPKGRRAPARLRRALLRGLHAAPDERWPAMDELLGELQTLVASRRTRWVVGGLTVGLLAAGFGWSRWVELGQRCAGAGDKLAGIWDEPRRQQVEAAILGTELSYSADTWERVGPRLDEYAQAWIKRHTEVCEATSVRREQSAEVMDLRMACLEQRRVDLRATVDVLARLDPRSVENAVDLVEGLATLSRCDDVEALQAQLPPPEDTEVAKQVSEQREHLAEARARLDVRDPERSLVIASAVVDEARRLAYGPLVAEALLLRASAEDRLDRFADGERDLNEAHLLALESQHVLAEAEAAIRLIFVVGVRGGRFDRAHEWSRMAQAMSRRRGADERMEARLLLSLAGLYSLEGNLPEALDHAERALAVETKVLGPRHPMVALTLLKLAIIRRKLGDLDGAAALHEQALGITGDTVGSRHPKYADVLSSWADVLQDQGKLDEAMDLEIRALTIIEESSGPQSERLARYLMNYATSLRIRGRLSEAQAQFERALVISEQLFGLDHLQIAQAKTNVGSILAEQGETARGLAYFEDAVRIVEASLGSRNLNLAGPLSNVGAALQDLGRYDEAAPYLQRALSINEEHLGPDHLDLSVQVLGLAQIAMEQGDLVSARAYAERGLLLREKNDAPPARLSSVRFMVARAIWPDGERQRAHDLAVQAVEGMREFGEPEVGMLVEAQAWLDEHPLPDGPGQPR